MSSIVSLFSCSLYPVYTTYLTSYVALSFDPFFLFPFFHFSDVEILSKALAPVKSFNEYTKVERGIDIFFRFASCYVLFRFDDACV